MIARAVRDHFGSRIGAISAIDLGCHEGYFSFMLRELGVPRVVGVDVRPENLEKARFLAEIRKEEGVEWVQCDCEDLDRCMTEAFDLCLCVGLIYHLENPIRCLRQAAAVCREMIIVETQVVEEIEGETEWGRRDCVMSYQGHFALIDETIFDDNPETGRTALALCPSPRAIETILEKLGFARVEAVPAPEDGNEQLVRGRRVVVAGFRN